MTSVQFVMKNFVLCAAILVVTFGMATPKRRLLRRGDRRPARPDAVRDPAGPLPGHPGAMEGLARWTTPVAPLSFDALFLLILAVGST